MVEEGFHSAGSGFESPTSDSFFSVNIINYSFTYVDVIQFDETLD